MVTTSLRPKDQFSLLDAVDHLADGLIDRQPINVGSFWEFVRDIWSLSYEDQNFFKAWHVGVICEDVERALQEGKNYVAVLPRFHLKSTILGHAFSIWRFLTASTDTGILYLSYSDGMSQYHISEINKSVRRNPQLKEWMIDKSPKADFAFRYHINNRQAEIKHGGLFSFKRGMHVNGAVIADDILRDPDNPLNLSQLIKAEEHFFAETMYIANKNVPTFVLGTPMAPNDIFAKLQDNELFISRVLPALDPVPDRRVLFPERISEEELLQYKRSHPKAFASEMMLVPYLSTESYISDDEIQAIEDPTLKSLDPYKRHNTEASMIVAGFDIGKKRHPSHFVVYAYQDGRLIQIHQRFLDGWSYTDQIQFLNDASKNFGIDKGYVDNTRGEFEERGLVETWEPITFTQKNKRTMAQRFEEYITNDRIRMIVNERQRQQITCVDGDLKAPDTPMGHGDAFFSNALAILAHAETEDFGTTSLGDMQDMAGNVDRSEEAEEIQEQLNRLFASPSDHVNVAQCPNCDEAGGWIEERGLCLFCLYRSPDIDPALIR
tara:strand:+ start:20543 stop:22189 length:1647 start_codon:yes stop_codon:yes gene_type:complete